MSAMDCRWPVHVFVLWLLVVFLGGDGGTVGEGETVQHLGLEQQEKKFFMFSFHDF